MSPNNRKKNKLVSDLQFNIDFHLKENLENKHSAPFVLNSENPAKILEKKIFSLLTIYLFLISEVKNPNLIS